MTQPTGGVPGAPATDANPAPGVPGTPVPPAPQPTVPGQDSSAPVDVASLPANVQALIAALRQENGAHRQGKTAAEQAAAQAKQQRDEALKAFGLNPDGSAASDPQAVAAQLSQRASDAEARAWGATVKLSVFESAAALGADPGALLDSLSFVDSLDEMVDDDPSSADFKAALNAKIAAALAANPALRARTGATPGGASGGDFTGGSGAGQPITEDQLKNMSNAEKVKALQEGRLRHLL